VGCLLSLVTVSFAVQKLFSLMQSHLFIVSFRCWAFWVLFRKSFPISVPMYFLLLLELCQSFRPYIKVFDTLWVDFGTGWKTGI
jgi:hypothetical protein